MTDKMIMRCEKTNRIFFSAADAQEHAEALGAAHFVEVAPTEKVWLERTSGKYCVTPLQLSAFCKRTGTEPSLFEEVTVLQLQQFLDAKKASKLNHPTVARFANQKFLDALIEVRGYSQLKAEKALWFTHNESVAKAEAWLKEHASDPGIHLPLKEVPPEGGPIDRATYEEVAVDMPEYVVTYVDSSLVNELVVMGFKESRAQKAVYLTKNSGTSKAIKWISAHAEDIDVDAIPRKHLTKQEAELLAAELQERLRKERESKEKAEARERELSRIEGTKQMQETKQLLDEKQKERDAFLREKAKQEELALRKKLKQQLREDYIERFGVPPPEDQDEVKPEVAGMKPKDQIIHYLNVLKNTYKTSNPAALKLCLSTLKAYLSNLEQHSAEPKFKKINKDGKAFSERVAPFQGATAILKVCGFVEDSQSLEIKSFVADGWLCGQAVKFIDVFISQL